MFRPFGVSGFQGFGLDGSRVVGFMGSRRQSLGQPEKVRGFFWGLSEAVEGVLKEGFTTGVGCTTGGSGCIGGVVFLL